MPSGTPSLSSRQPPGPDPAKRREPPPPTAEEARTLYIEKALEDARWVRGRFAGEPWGPQLALFADVMIENDGTFIYNPDDLYNMYGAPPPRGIFPALAFLNPTHEEEGTECIRIAEPTLEDRLRCMKDKGTVSRWRGGCAHFRREMVVRGWLVAAVPMGSRRRDIRIITLDPATIGERGVPVGEIILDRNERRLLGQAGQALEYSRLLTGDALPLAGHLGEKLTDDAARLNAQPPPRLHDRRQADGTANGNGS